MKRLWFTAAFAMLISIASVAVADTVMKSGAAVMLAPGEMVWAPGTGMLKGASTSVLFGDPSKAGEYALRVQAPDGTKFPPHTHSEVEQVTVISGTIGIALGSEFDAAKLKWLPAGSYFEIPANTPHYAATKGVTVIEIHAIGPRTMTPATM